MPTWINSTDSPFAHSNSTININSFVIFYEYSQGLVEFSPKIGKKALRVCYNYYLYTNSDSNIIYKSVDFQEKARLIINMCTSYKQSQYDCIN